MNIYLGFDPGGKNDYGWAVCASQGRCLRVLSEGTTGSSQAAYKEALNAIPRGGTILGVGIDAPLFWSESGERDVDNLVRKTIQKLGAPYPQGTVQQINSLRGACLVQGILIANLIYRRFPDIHITESHPKALLYFLGVAKKSKLPDEVLSKDLSEYLVQQNGWNNEHERDAILGAITACAQTERRQGWRNLFEIERYPIIPFNYSVGYWIPWDLVKTANCVTSPLGEKIKGTR